MQTQILIIQMWCFKCLIPLQRVISNHDCGGSSWVLGKMKSEKSSPCGRWGRRYSHSFLNNIWTPQAFSALWPLQEIPSACRDALTFTVTQSRRGDGSDNPGSLCGRSTCVVTQDAHRINLRIFRNQTQIANDSVYVPAVGESECCWETVFHQTWFGCWAVDLWLDRPPSGQEHGGGASSGHRPGQLEGSGSARQWIYDRLHPRRASLPLDGNQTHQRDAVWWAAQMKHGWKEEERCLFISWE